MTKTIIEVNGVKMEVDLRHAKRVDELRVGDRVKVLVKNYASYAVYAGTVIGFEPFSKLPTIIVAYIEMSYGKEGNIKFVHFNAETKDIEIIKAIDDDCLDLSKADAINSFDRMIAAKQAEIEEIERKKAYFLNHFQAYWEPLVKPELPIEAARTSGDPF